MPNFRIVYAELCRWMSLQSCLDWLLEVKLNNDRIGPLVVLGFVNDSMQPGKTKLPPTVHFQVSCVLTEDYALLHELKTKVTKRRNED